MDRLMKDANGIFQFSDNFFAVDKTQKTLFYIFQKIIVKRSRLVIT